MNKFLLDLIARKKTELKTTELRFEASKDEAEVRALGETLQTLRDEITAAEEQLKKLEDDDNKNDDNNDDNKGNDDFAVRTYDSSCRILLHTFKCGRGT